MPCLSNSALRSKASDSRAARLIRKVLYLALVSGRSSTGTCTFCGYVSRNSASSLFTFDRASSYFLLVASRGGRFYRLLLDIARDSFLPALFTEQRLLTSRLLLMSCSPVSKTGDQVWRTSRIEQEILFVRHLVNPTASGESPGENGKEKTQGATPKTTHK